MSLRPEDTDVVILCGGLGTRLRSALQDKPKSLAPVGGKPFLAWTLDYLVQQGCRRVVLCAGYLGDAIQEFCATSNHPLELAISVETELLGTAGAVKQAENQIKSAHFLLLNGDSLCPISLRDLTARHDEADTLGTVTVTHIQDCGQYGSVDVRDGRVERFREKTGEVGPGLVNAGIYAFKREALASVPVGAVCSMERELLPSLTPHALAAYVTHCSLIDIGTPDRLADAQVSLYEIMNS